MRIATYAAFLSIAALSVLARADEQAAKQPSKMKEEIMAFKAACKSDIDKLCSDIKPGEGRVAACLKSKENELSSECTQARSNLKAKVEARMNKAELALRKNCGSDVQKFCSNVPSGGGKIMECLGEHTSDLTNSCKSFQSKVAEKAAKYMG